MKRATRFHISLIAILATLIFTALVGAQGGDVRRRTIAITYFRDPVKVMFAGTTLRPTAKGEATVERWRKRNTSEINITIENMIPAYNYGADYNTYVLWAITPAGQVDNLGEFRLSGGSARLKTATAYQTFAMIITAEPHYLVRLPSRMVVLENLTPISKNVQVQASEVFFMGDSGSYYTDNSVPALAERDYNKTPMELLQARRAVQIARLADGERFDPADFGSGREVSATGGRFVPPGRERSRSGAHLSRSHIAGREDARRVRRAGAGRRAPRGDRPPRRRSAPRHRDGLRPGRPAGRYAHEVAGFRACARQTQRHSSIAPCKRRRTRAPKTARSKMRTTGCARRLTG